MNRKSDAAVPGLSPLKVRPALKPLLNLFFDKSLTQKASLNALASALDYGARLVIGFLVTPLVVAGLGEYYFGAWQILNRLVGYISPASGRPTQALKWTLANLQAVDDHDQKRRHVGSAVVVWALFVPVLAVLGGILAWFAPYWLKTPAESFVYVRLACVILVANLSLVTLSEIPHAVLEGENLGYKRIGLTVILVVVGGGLTWLALYLHLGIVGVSAAAVVSTCLTGLLFLHVVRTYVPWFGVARPSFPAMRRFLRLSWWFLGWNLVMNVMMTSDVVLLGLFVSVESVTAYSLSKYAPETLISIIAIMVFGSAPGLGSIIGSGNLARAAKIRSEMMSLTWLVVTVLGTTILLWNRAFVTLWVGEKQYVGPLPCLLIVLMVTQFVLIRNDANIIDLTLRLSRKVLLGLVSLALSLTLASVLVASFRLPIVGLCLGIIAGRLIISLGYPLLVARFLKLSFSAQLRGALRPAIVAALLFSLATGLDSLRSHNNSTLTVGWIGLAILVMLTCGVVWLLAFYAGLSRGQRATIIRRARMVANPSRG